MKQSAISVSGEVLNGFSVFTNTRVPVANLFDYITGGYTIDQFLEGFPSVKKEQVIEVIQFAKLLLIKT